jgi:type I restriction enzyme S subunit
MAEAQIPHGYKQTEAGVIPEDWDTRPCSALSALITVGVVIRPTQYYTKQGVPALRSANIREDRIDAADMVFISEKANALLSKSQVRTGDVLTVRTGYPGTSAVVPPSFAGANCIDILITRPSKAVSSKYLSAWINSPFGKHQILRNQGGLAQQHFNVSDLRNLVVALPSLAEQEAIAEALSDADTLIESLEQFIAKKRQIKQGAMQELLTGKKRLPGFATKPGYKQTEMGVIPEDWGVCRLSDGIKLLSGYHVLAQYCNADGHGVPYITGPADFPKGIIQHTKYTAKPGTICHANDVLVTVKGSGAGTLVVADSEYCISRQLMSIRVTEWNTGYIYFSLLRDASLFGAAATGLIPGLSRGDILNKAVPIPPTTAEQTAIATILTDMDAEIAALEEKLAKARQLKQGMMQELLTGRIRLVGKKPSTSNGKNPGGTST